MVALPQPQLAHQDLDGSVSQFQGEGLLPNMQSMEEVGQLVMKMSQAGQHGDIFKLFAEHVTQLVPGLTHISVLLLPESEHNFAGTSGMQPVTPAKGGVTKSKLPAMPPAVSRLEWQQYMGGAKASRADAAKKQPELLTWPYADSQTGSEMPVLDWRTCKDVMITKARGLDVRHPAPSYPASCTAACYVARSQADSISSPDYLQDGPHFADWGEMQEQGAVSMASAPVHMSNQVVAVLTLASSRQAAFEESKAKLVWVLSFVLAPYTHILSQATHKTDANLFIEGVMPRLLGQGLSRQGAECDSQDCPHDNPLCPHCQLASTPQANPTKQEGRIRGSSTGSFPTELEASSTTASMGYQHSVRQTSGSQAATTMRTFQADHHLAPQDSDLDWGDFFFNLVSMCIVYVHFSEAAVAGESNAAVMFSMAIAAVDILLLALRWLWYDHFVSSGGMTSSIFTLHRLIVLPVANTWMSWSLLHKMQWDPTPPLLGGLGLLMTMFLFIGLKIRFFLHAPLQLATVLLAAASAHRICTAVQASTGGATCLSLISVLQMVLGYLIPSFLTFMLDFRVGSGYMPHVQAKGWAVLPS